MQKIADLMNRVARSEATIEDITALIEESNDPKTMLATLSLVAETDGLASLKNLIWSYRAQVARAV